VSQGAPRMKCWKMVGLSLILGAMALAVEQWLRESAWARSYSSVTVGMTVNQVRHAMERDEDAPDERNTLAGEFERSWTFQESGVRITVVFDQHGLSSYKEFGPSYCGVTPLMGELVPAKDPD
jgi:hypothetical protein